MGFIQGVMAGSALRERENPDLLRRVNPVGEYAAITRSTYRPMGGHIRRGSEPDQPLGMNPAAIHQRAAELVLQEKELDLQKTALEVEKLKEANAMASDTRRRANEAEPFERQKAIDEEYARRVGMAGAEEKMTDERKSKMQAEDFKRAMMGLHMGDGEAIKNFVNRYGDPSTNLESVNFDPSGSGEVIVKPAGDKKPMLFKDPEALYKGLLFWMDPQSAKVIAERTKGQKKGDDDEVTADEKSKIMERLGKQWDEDNKPAAGGELTEEQKKAKQAWIKETYEEEYAGAGKKKKAISPPKAVEEKAGAGKQAAQGADMTGDKPPVPGARKSPRDGNWYVRSESGWSMVVPDEVSVATQRERVKESEAGGFDYSTGKGAIDREGSSVAGAERVRGKIEKPKPKAKAGTGKQALGTTSWTDKKTGEIVSRRYYADGTYDEEREPKNKKGLH